MAGAWSRGRGSPGLWKVRGRVMRAPCKRRAQDRIRPSAVVSGVNDAGAPVSSATVQGTLYSADGALNVTCITLATGECTLQGPDYFRDAPATPGAFAFRIDGIVVNEVKHPPGKAVFASNAAAVLLRAAEQAGLMDDQSLLAIHFPGVTADPYLSKQTECYPGIDTGTGLSTSPLGVVFQPQALDASATLVEVPVDLDGTGLSTTPLGVITLRTLQLDGTGLSTSPLGFSSLRIVALDGTGLSTSPLGFHALQLYTRTGGTGLSTSPLGYASQPILLGRGEVVGSINLIGSGYDALLTGARARTSDGFEGAAYLAATDAVDVGLTATISSQSVWATAMPVTTLP